METPTTARKQPKIFRATAMTLALCGLTSCGLTCVAQAQTLPSGPRLKDIPSPAYIGGHIREAYSGSTRAETVARREFSSGQSLWYANWGGWNGVGQYDFTGLNNGINWLVGNGKSATVHVLVGQDLYAPPWFVNGTWSNQQMDDMLRNLIYSVMDSNDNKNKVDVWNVANELFNDNGTYRTIKWNQLGWEADRSGLSGTDKINAQHPIFVRKAFQYSRDKSSRILELRDYNIEFPGPAGDWSKKHRGFYQLLKHMLNSGIPVDAVGIQGHYNVGNPWGLRDNGLRNVIRKYKELGLSVNMNEIDLAAGSPWEAAKAQQQKTEYQEIVRQALEGGVSRVETWGISDGGDKGWLTNEHPLLFDENQNPKPAYYGVQSALQQTGPLYIRARGTVGGERLELKVDNNTVASWILSRDWAGYYYNGYSGTHNVKVAFTNDAFINGKDRNVQVDYLWLNGSARQAETRPNMGANESGEWMWWNGAIDFGSVNSVNEN